MKWMCIWQYKEGIISINIIYYVRWWLLDRFVTVWECWIGYFFLKTPIIKFFNFLMGANIHHAVSIEAFIREFDLVSIDERYVLSFSLKCRKYGLWKETEHATLRFRAIQIENGCAIKGFLSPGSKVGQKSCVEKVSVVEEGAQVPKEVQVAGNPAYVVQHSTSSAENSSWVLGLLRILWMVFELCFFFGLLLLGQYVFITDLVVNLKWRYTAVVQWSLMLLWFSFTGVASSVVFK